MNLEEFDAFIKGKTFWFYGVCNDEFKLNGEVYGTECVGDELRDEMVSVNEVAEPTGRFFAEPIARVRIEYFDSDWSHEKLPGGELGYRFIDLDGGHVWFEFGTNFYDSYYPMVFWRYTPRIDQPATSAPRDPLARK